MNSLAPEMLNRIFVVLPSDDKVECMTVCKKWDQVIQALCLFDTIRIASMTQLKKVMEKIRNKLFQTDQVERLILDLDPGSSFDIVNFINQFPNLRVIYMERSQSTQFQARTATFNCKRIEYIFDSEGHALTSYFLKSKKCTHLRQLVANEASLFSHIPENFISLFSYMPYLVKLKLCIISASLEEFEKLHNMLPSLKSLSIHGLTLTDVVLSASIEPASSVTHSEIGMDRVSLLFQTKYFEYVSKKYTSLLEWKYSSRTTSETQESIDLFYKNGVVPFLQSLASQLKSCHLDLLKIPQDVSDMLNQINYRDKDAGLSLIGNKIVSELARIIQANRTECIARLSLAYTSFSPDLKILEKLTALEELTVYKDTDFEYSDQKHYIVLNDILKVCADTVTTLRIHNFLVKFDTLDTCEYKIRNLLFLRVCLDRGIDAFISRYIHGLDNLTFDSVRFSENKLFLPDLNLLHLQISDPIYLEHNNWISKCELKVLVSTLNIPDRRMYFSSSFTNSFGFNRHFDISDWSAYPQVKSIPYDKARVYPTLTFELNSVKKVTITASNSKLRKFENNDI